MDSSELMGLRWLPLHLLSASEHVCMKLVKHACSEVVSDAPVV